MARNLKKIVLLAAARMDGRNLREDITLYSRTLDQLALTRPEKERQGPYPIYYSERKNRCIRPPPRPSPLKGSGKVTTLRLGLITIC